MRISRLAFTLAMVLLASHAFGQSSGFVSGPLTWTPTLQLREAGVDSNVFNTGDAKQDVTGAIGAQMIGNLNIPAFDLALRGTSEYTYFERYRSQAGVNSDVAAKVTLPWTRFQPSIYGAYVRAKDRTSNELDVRAPRRGYTYGGAVAMNIGQRFAVSADASRIDTHYLTGSQFAGADVAAQLNHHTTAIAPGVRVAVTPLTSVAIDTAFSVDEFDSNRLRDTRNLRASVSMGFTPDAIVSGHATVGYHKMSPRYQGPDPGGAQPFTGLTASIDLGYTLLGVTHFGGRFGRDANYSASTTASYYVSTNGGIDITQTLPGPFMLLVRASREKLGYPATTLAPAHDGFANVLGGGIQIAISQQAHISLNYDFASRRSGVDTAINYDRRHIYTTMSYGF